jgi:hypothetical protein
MRSHSHTEEHSKSNMFEDYKAWRAMGEGGTSPTWSGYLSCISAEKMIAFKDTLSPEIYAKPHKYATGWSKASETQKAAANKSFLKEPLPVREGARSRAKKYVYPQREKNADEHVDPEVKKVSLLNSSCLSVANKSTRFTNNDSASLERLMLKAPNGESLLSRNTELHSSSSPRCHFHH